MSHVPMKERALNGGTQKVYRFDNGFGASVVQHSFSYGSECGQWELAVIKFDDDDWHLTYDTEITDDVIGRLEWPEVETYLGQIAAIQVA